MRNPRQEARDRLGGRYDARVLEPSPPAVNEPPWFADDPVVGGDVAPVVRPGTRTWGDLCDEAQHEGLRPWCEERWLVPRPLDPLPARFVETRAALHALAEHVITPCRHAANGKIGLRYTYRGFGTPFLGDDRQVRVEDGLLLDGERAHPITTLGDAAAALGIAPGAPRTVYSPTTEGDPGEPLAVDTGAARALGDWFGFTTLLLEQLRAEASAEDDASRVQLWPEHFDMAVTLGPVGRRANYGGSPGDDGHPEPYLYVGPFESRSGSFWNEPFGASLGYADILDGADPLAFLRRGKELLRS